MSDSKSPLPPVGYPEGNPPPGYPTQAPQPQYAETVPVKTQQRGDKGFVEGCLAGLCCCWLCEECC
uniref:Cysteine-rich transmembrane domain-containing protein n=1 Tax=Picea sitchensis TaxID=3332 RepID=A9NKL1_PICSI|nr:unknown [Picea sitchensis]ABK25065.1 unknown [Picea sitchensis]ABR18421.1 unknown [Picea sitchensis]